MPVRSLSSSVLVWPDPGQVVSAVRLWAAEQAAGRGDLLAVGYFGSYARGDSGVGSDVDIVVLVRASSEPFIERGRSWDTLSLPVPADLVVYTADEWRALEATPGTLAAAILWVYRREG